MPVPDSLTLAEFKQIIGRQLTGDDPLLELMLESAFAQAQAPPPHGCGRLLAPADGDPELEQRIVLTHGERRVRVPDGRDITQVLVDDIEVTDYELVARDGYVVQVKLPRWGRVAKVTGKFGFTDLPANLKLAIYTLAARTESERDGGFADQYVLAEGAGAQNFRKLPLSVKLVFDSYAVGSDRWGLA